MTLSTKYAVRVRIRERFRNRDRVGVEARVRLGTFFMRPEETVVN